MENSRLVSLLKTFSPEEFQRFDSFVRSPFYCQNPKMEELLSHIRDCLSTENQEGLEKEKLFRVLFGQKESFEAQKVHDQFSQLLKLAFSFLGQEAYREESVAQKRHVLKGLSGRNLNAEFFRQFRKSKDLSGKTSQNPAFSYLDEYLLAWEADAVLSKERREGEKSLQNLLSGVENLDRFYFITRLKAACEVLNRKNILNLSREEHLVGDLVDLLEREPAGPLREHPLIQLYVKVYRMLTHPGEEEFYFDLVSLLDQHVLIIARDEARKLYAFAQNYCVKKINQGKREFLEHIFYLYQALLNRDLLLENGFIPHAYLKNIVTVGVRLKQFEWVRNFLNESSPKIHPGHRKNVVTYNMAVVYFEEGRQRKALRMLQEVVFTDIFYQLGARALQLKIYYELEEDDSLMYLVRAFRSFIKRNKEISRQQAMVYENLFRFTQKVYRLKITQSYTSPSVFGEKVRQVTEAIHQSKGIANKQWLTQKLAELDPVAVSQEA